MIDHQTYDPTLTEDFIGTVWDTDETLVADGRDALSPSEHVEQKLIGLLKESPLLVSQVQRRLRPGPR